MCLAIPMKVIELRGQDSLAPTAIVDANGFNKEVRLDIVDRIPKTGDYLIVHAGFAISSLDAREAEKNIELMRNMAEGVTE